MKYKLWPIVAIVVGAVIVSCSVYIAPPFTDIIKISQLKPAMKFKQVVDVLGVEPYDIYHVEETGSMLATFNYRLKERRMRVSTLNRDEFIRRTSDENSQTAGDLYYNKEYKTLHVLFNKDGALASYITSEGVENSNHIIISENTIQFANEKKINYLDPAFDSQSIRVNLQKGQEGKEGKTFRLPFNRTRNTD
jgi:hypothetical protein